MAYSFQTFSVGEVLTSSKMNQLEVNVRDHIHGTSSGVSATLGAVEITSVTDAFLIVGSADATKKARFEVDGITTGVTRVLTVLDANFSIGAASNAEVEAGTSTTKSVTPAGLFSLPKVLDQAGYLKLPGGVVIQWGKATTDGSGVATVTLNVAYGTLNAVVVATPVTSGGTDIADAHTLTVSNFQLKTTAGSTNVSWISIGY